MPIFEIECTDCEYVHEILVNKKEDLKKYRFRCYSCGGRSYKILPSKVAKAVIH